MLPADTPVGSMVMPMRPAKHKRNSIYKYYRKTGTFKDTQIARQSQ